MIETSIVMVGLCIIAWILSQANIKITIKHEYDKCAEPVVVNSDGTPVDVTKLQEQLDKDRDRQKVATFDDVIKEVQSILGGGSDE